MKPRSDRIRITSEARVLRALRMNAGLSMRKAALALGISDSTIAHIETGRMNPPSGERLLKFLGVYGGLKLKSFQERVRHFAEMTNPRDELIELISRANSAQVKTILAVTKSLLEG